MKKYTLLWHVFELQDNAYNFLERYIQRMDQYAHTHTISPEIVDDIKYSMVEKLYRYETPINEKDVIEVANSLGEPEDMFEEHYTWDNSEKSTFNWNWFSRPTFIDKEKPLIRWVCYWIAKKCNISVRITRLIAIVLAFVNGIGLAWYAVAAIFVPYKDKKKTTWLIGNLFFEMVRIALWLFIISSLLPLVFGAIVWTGILLFTPEVGSQSISPWIPQYMYRVMWAVSIACVILLIWSIGALLKQKWINKSVALVSTIIVIIGGLVTAWTVYKTVIQVTSHPIDTTQTFVFSWADMLWKGIMINLDWIKEWEKFFEDIPTSELRTHIIASSGNDLVVTVDTTTRAWSDKQGEYNVSKLNPIDITGSLNSLLITSPKNVFNEQVPFAFVSRTITIAVPANKEIIFVGNKRVNAWLESYYMEQVSPWIYRDWTCDNEEIYIYDTKTRKFICKNITWTTRKLETDIYEDSEYSWKEAQDMPPMNNDYNNENMNR